MGGENGRGEWKGRMERVRSCWIGFGVAIGGVWERVVCSVRGSEGWECNFRVLGERFCGFWRSGSGEDGGTLVISST